MEIRILERQGRSIRQIMREGLSRNTVCMCLRDGGKVKYGPREARACKLDPFKGCLLERIEQTGPSRFRQRCQCARSALRHGLKRRRQPAQGVSAGVQRGPHRSVVHFETASGHQLQADFSRICRGRDRLLGFMATLGFQSRHARALHPSRAIRQLARRADRGFRPLRRRPA